MVDAEARPYRYVHKLSPKHLDRYVQELAARHNLREADTSTCSRAPACARVRVTRIEADGNISL